MNENMLSNGTQISETSSEVAKNEDKRMETVKSRISDTLTQSIQPSEQKDRNVLYEDRKSILPSTTKTENMQHMFFFFFRL